MCWHLLVCSHRIYEVITATLGPLPLVQPPKSKPFTPLFSCAASAIHSAVLDRLPTTHASQPEFPAGVARLAGGGAPGRRGVPGPGWCARSEWRAGPEWRAGLGQEWGAQEKWPLRALAVAETRPQGPTGRVGAGLMAGSPPR
jgi:hypothetical protein